MVFHLAERFFQRTLAHCARDCTAEVYMFTCWCAKDGNECQIETMKSTIAAVMAVRKLTPWYVLHDTPPLLHWRPSSAHKESTGLCYGNSNHCNTHGNTLTASRDWMSSLRGDKPANCCNRNSLVRIAGPSLNNTIRIETRHKETP